MQLTQAILYVDRDGPTDGRTDGRWAYTWVVDGRQLQHASRSSAAVDESGGIMTGSVTRNFRHFR